MLSRMKTALNDLIVRTQDSQPSHQDKPTLSENGYGRIQSAIEYSRPLFLGLTAKETTAISTQERIPIIPKCPTVLPFNAGYCEIINAGKSIKNEDCAAALTINLESSQAFHVHECEPEWDDELQSSYDPTVTSLENDESNESSCDTVMQNGSESNENKLPEGNNFLSEGQLNRNTPDVNDNISDESPSTECCDSLRFDYFALFDGHAGPAAALYAANIVHHLLTERLREILHLLLGERDATVPVYLTDDEIQLSSTRLSGLTYDSLITGIIQEVVVETDKHIEADRKHWNSRGGCTVVIAVFVLGKLFVAGAGDSRAVLCKSIPVHDDKEKTAGKKIMAVPMSQDFTPQTERRRLQYLAYLKPELLGSQFGRLEYIKRITQSDIGKKVLHRDYHMTGWTYKTITADDLKPPMVQGSGKGSRLLGTIGVTRGLGDHSVIALNILDNVPLKPFLSPVPEVRVHDLSDSHHEDNILIMGSDGLWDVITNETAAQIVFNTLAKTSLDDQSRYCKAAQELAQQARGEWENGLWRLSDGRPGSPDDITVFVIPMLEASKVHKSPSVARKNSEQ
uniref:Protein phosphatase 1A-like n=1 Tax=Phallusia mammillata TaxID=59560 RepID=A0A6F9DQ04_9ASCI|nr:protein phosphatase 1A-like [Phallusia mammillata]